MRNEKFKVHPATTLYFQNIKKISRKLIHFSLARTCRFSRKKSIQHIRIFPFEHSGPNLKVLVDTLEGSQNDRLQSAEVVFSKIPRFEYVFEWESVRRLRGDYGSRSNEFQCWRVVFNEKICSKGGFSLRTSVCSHVG